MGERWQTSILLYTLQAWKRQKLEVFPRWLNQIVSRDFPGGRDQINKLAIKKKGTYISQSREEK